MELKFNYDTDSGEFDLGIENWDLETDDGLEASVLVSLFTDARVEEDELEGLEREKRGFWGDAVNNDAQHVTGSKLWLLDRSKSTDETLEQVRETAEECLQWLIEDGVAESIEVTTEYLNRYTISIEIQITKPSGKTLNFKYNYVWEARASGV